jgi:hypothetical protein
MHLKPQSSLLRNALTLLLASIHKSLIHGTQIINLGMLPIEQLSEEAQNKYTYKTISGTRNNKVLSPKHHGRFNE